MKLVLTIIHDEDAHKLVNHLARAGFISTKLASTGGLLKTGNTTLFVGVEKEKVNEVIDIIKDQCKTTKKMSLINAPSTSIAEGFMPYPVEVTVSGATIFVVDVDKYIKI